MVKKKANRLSRQDWIHGALELLISTGIEGVKIVPLAARLGVTSGSFYWHFKNRGQLFSELLDYWEHEMTDKAIENAKHFEGPPQERILRLMEEVMSTGMARYDLSFWHWAQSNPAANRVFLRVLEKRFAFAAWMFRQAGFSKNQAEIRGRMMVVYMMGESTLVPDSLAKRKRQLKQKLKILTGN